MNVFTSIKLAIVTYKAARAKAVVTAYADLTIDVWAKAIPPVMAAYKNAAHDLIDVTFENPQVAIKLADAVEDAAGLYGPVLKKHFELINDSAEFLKADPGLRIKLDALLDTLRDISKR